MEKKIQYSVLQYSPSLVSGESINIGVIAAAIDQPLFKFVETKKLARVKEFDDTVDIEILKTLLGSIKAEVDTTLENCMKQFDVKQFVQFYVNEYHFSRVIEIPYSDFEESIQELKRMYLSFDFTKSQRPSHADELRFMTKILQANKAQYKRNVKEIGSYHERITYDLRVENYYIKLFWLKGKDLSKLLNDVKAWAWNADHQTDNVKTVIIYNSDSSNQLILQNILSILRDSSAKVFSWDDGMEWLSKISASTKR